MTSRPPSPLATAVALALGAAVSLGLARFSYALLLRRCAPTSAGATSPPAR